MIVFVLMELPYFAVEFWEKLSNFDFEVIDELLSTLLHFVRRG